MFFVNTAQGHKYNTSVKKCIVDRILPLYFIVVLSCNRSENMIK